MVIHTGIKSGDSLKYIAVSEKLITKKAEREMIAKIPVMFLKRE